jgi:hypothetical protein
MELAIRVYTKKGGPMSGNKWKEIQHQLKAIMKKEVSLMREVLATMHQEEHFILTQDIINREGLIKERALLNETLNSLKINRLDLVRQLTDLLPFSKKNRPFEQLLAIDDEGYSELQLLQDQFKALSQRTDFQHQRNAALEHTRQQLAPIPSPLKVHVKTKEISTPLCEK